MNHPLLSEIPYLHDWYTHNVLRDATFGNLVFARRLVIPSVRGVDQPQCKVVVQEYADIASYPQVLRKCLWPRPNLHPFVLGPKTKAVLLFPQDNRWTLSSEHGFQERAPLRDIILRWSVEADGWSWLTL